MTLVKITLDKMTLRRSKKFYRVVVDFGALDDRCTFAAKNIAPPSLSWSGKKLRGEGNKKVRACVCERERERERERECVCVCVCVCERERGRERDV